jgi:putative ABC transport system ATP-binding protein
MAQPLQDGMDQARAGGEPLPAGDAPERQVLQARDLRRQYPLGQRFVNALQGVSLSVERGEFVAVMGPSGSGKSTLLHLLGGLDAPTDGEVTLGDRPLAHLSDDEITLVRRRQVGFVFQFYNLLPALTAAENVALPLLLDGQKPEACQTRVDELLALVGLADRRDHRPGQLSGGEQQRVAIARAFVQNPQIVLADEPTGNLDSRSGTQVLELLQRACKEREVSVVVVTHDPRAAAYADRVVFLRDGTVVRQWRPAPSVPLDAPERVGTIAEIVAALEF